MSNIWTNENTTEASITVLPVPGDELGRGRGGALRLSAGTRWYLKETLWKQRRTLVVALPGGNALLKRGEPLEADIQRKISNWRPEPSPSYAAMARGVECTATAHR